MIIIHHLNEVHMRVECDPSTAQEIQEYFTFAVPGARFTPAFKNKMWDGKIRLFNLRTKTLYVGLLTNLIHFATERDYHITFADPNKFAGEEFSLANVSKFTNKLKLPFEPRDYQQEAFVHAVRNNRALLLSPTASGKSLIIYLLSAYYYKHKVLIVVPTTGLVHQMASDFVSYGCPENQIHKIFSGQEKMTDAAFVVTTWQSIYKLPKEWFQQYGAVIGDEAHQFKAKSLVEIMEKMTDCKYRFGFTGTLDGTQTNKLVLEGLFGSVKQVTTTAELMEKKTVADLKIKAIVLSYPDDVRQLYAKNKTSYADEVNYLCDHNARTNFIINLVSSLKDNTLLLFNYILHGKVLHEKIKQQNPDKNVFFVYGKVEGEEREEIRKYVEQNPNCIVIASYKTFSTGVNIPNLHNVVFGSPSKSRIRVLQSIGRGLRVSEDKSSAVLYDVADDMSWKSFHNHTIKHFSERIQMYNQEKFEYKIYTVKI